MKMFLENVSCIFFRSTPGGDFGEPAWDILLQGHETRRGGRVDLGPGGHALHEFYLEKCGNLILAFGILWRLNYFISVRSRLTSAHNNNNNAIGSGDWTMASGTRLLGS